MTYLDPVAKADHTLCIDTAVDVSEDCTPDMRSANVASDFPGVLERLVGYLSVALARLYCSHLERSFVSFAEKKA